MTTLRVISNGYGEDAIAAQLIQAIGLDALDVKPIPLVGDGRSYVTLGLTPQLVQGVLPSGGFLRRLSDVFRDLRSGLLGQCLNQRRVLSSTHGAYQLVVGDVFALLMATWRTTMPTAFFPTAKSERAIPHYAVECQLIRANAQLVFPRDIETHQRFQSARVPSRFFGNPMFDGMVSNAPKVDPPMVALLPGSRDEAVSNIRMMLTIVSKLSLKSSFQFVFSLSNHIQLPELQAAVADLPWTVHEQATGIECSLSEPPLTVKVSYQFYDVLQSSSVVIGLAGTANEQAMHAQRQLISFIGMGPQSSRQRFREQHRLIDGVSPILIDSNDVEEIATQLSHCLNTHSFPWTPLSDHEQSSARYIAACLRQEFFI